MLSGFKEFVARGNVVDLAVGVVMGAAFGAVVTGLVESFINPLIAMLFGAPNFDEVGFTVNGTLFPVGQIITALVNFILIAFAIYVFVIVPMNKFTAKMKKEDADEAPAEPSEEILLLREIRDGIKADKVNSKPDTLS